MTGFSSQSPATDDTGTEPAQSRLSAWWHGIPIRWQILTAVIVTFAMTGLVASSVGIIDARRRANVETDFHLGLWQQYITAQFSKLASEHEIDGVAATLKREFSRARHITATITKQRTGESVPLVSDVDDIDAAGSGERGDAAPEWFIAMVQSRTDVRNVDLTVRGALVANVSLAAKPDDEISEAWVLLRKVALWWVVGSLLTCVGLYFVLGYILGPLTAFANGIRELEDGHYDFRVPQIRIQELVPISANINTLASALQKAKADNSKLYRQLIAVQEDERRQIAADLHDEVGPCLFGIMAATSSIRRQAEALPAPQARSIIDATAEIVAISDKLRTMNRGLLARLRPVALGRVSLEELLSDLITSLARANPDVHFGRAMEWLPKSLGEAIDLTIYRSIQEGITNALRHSGATRIDIHIACAGPDGREPGGGKICVGIEDNGHGFMPGTPFGFGISAMRERVHLLGGSLAIGLRQAGGTVLAIEIPVSASTRDAA